MKYRIAVVTCLGKDRNYGGALQAYALHKQFGKLGFLSELISFSRRKTCEITNTTALGINRFFHHPPFVILKKGIRRIVSLPPRTIQKLKLKSFDKSGYLRQKAFDDFVKKHIPKTEVTYTKENINEVLDIYDFFVCGSDQVWNPKWYDEFYRMDFVPNTFPKFSYAASISVDSLTDEQQEVFENTLSSYVGVSVREKQAVALLKDLSPVTPVHSLDPTLLLDRTDWDSIASERLVKEPYIFCYFLDCGEKLRKLAKQYAKKKKMRVVCIPYVLNTYHKFDKKYSDIFIESATPADFISLIKHAELVLTDSFHASVFSSIYDKEFFAFRRYGAPGMSSRIETLTQMFGIEERFCNTDEKETISYMEQCVPVDFSKQDEFLRMREKSIAYLKDMLQKSEDMVKENEV